jgi:hypothetical protein
MSNLRNTSKELRDLGFSGTDQFMQGGHQIINSNRANAGPKRKNADWAKSDKIVQTLLLRVFPKLMTDEKQRERAGLWMRVIQLYYRAGYSFGDTAAEMGVKLKFVRNVLQKIAYVRHGKTTKGKTRKRVYGKASETSMGRP